jgi:hypothetical protein
MSSRFSTPQQGGGFVAFAIAILLSTGATGAEFPNVVGTWKVPIKGQATTPYQADQVAASMIKILRQDRDSFSGTVVGLKGKTERIVGSFRRDGKTFVYTSEKTAGVGKVQGNEMEICRTDVPCAVLTRSR